MRRFSCPACGDEMFFGNLHCRSCGAELAYAPAEDTFVPLVRACANRASVEACNWEAGSGAWCLSCALDADPEPGPLRAPFQEAKRRTLRQLLLAEAGVLGWSPTLRFDLREGSPEDPVITGHADGTITLDTAESDPVRREQIRGEMMEPYRTPLGHVRHELGHWYWQAASGGVFSLVEFRSVFGDEREPYQEALERHYGRPDDGTWRESHVSRYAAAHPWEDFAESFAHVLHVRDTLEAVDEFMGDGSPGPGEPFEQMYARWSGLSAGLNEINRAMGTADLYPFAPAPDAVAKIHFVHEALGGAG